jgi:hypothetical protein
MEDTHGGAALRAGPPGWTALVYLALFALSVPWYVPDGPLRIWLGLPYWVVLSLCAIAGVAAFTVFVVSRYWPEDDPS